MMLWTVQAVYSAVQLPFLVVFLFFVFFLLLTLSQTGFVPDADNKACADVHPLHENEQATLSSHSPSFWSLFFLRIRGWCSFEYLVFCWSRWPVGLLFLWQCLCHFAITNIILDFIIISVLRDFGEVEQGVISGAKLSTTIRVRNHFPILHRIQLS